MSLSFYVTTTGKYFAKRDNDDSKYNCVASKHAVEDPFTGVSGNSPSNFSDKQQNRECLNIYVVIKLLYLLENVKPPYR